MKGRPVDNSIQTSVDRRVNGVRRGAAKDLWTHPAITRVPAGHSICCSGIQSPSLRLPGTDVRLLWKLGRVDCMLFWLSYLSVIQSCWVDMFDQ